jgi:predicted nucleotidyltransferase
MNKSGLSSQDIELIRSIFKNVPSVQKVRLYGSRARGDYKTTSDIDFSVSGTNLNSSDMARLRGFFDESTLIYKVDLVNEGELNECSLKEAIERDGVLFYEK